MWLASWPVLTVRDSGISLCRNGPAFTPTASVAPRCDREIIGCSARARQRKVPPLLPIVHKTLLRHGRNQQVPPSALLWCDRSRPGMRLDVGTIIAGAHIDACFRGAGARVSGAVGVGFVGVELG